MTFSWIDFLERHGVDYSDHGSNVEVACPFCATDPGQHMAISLDGRGWHCWRNSEHRGRSPVRLVQGLINCTWQQAFEIAGSVGGTAPPAGLTLEEAVSALLDPPVVVEREPPSLELPDSFRPLSTTSVSARPYRDYVARRGFYPPELDLYDVYFDASGGRWHGRIVFVIKDRPDHIVGFTGRAISDRMKPRYLFEGSTDSTLLWSYWFPQQANILVLTEGPFDALKINVLGGDIDVWATCCMTSGFSRNQRAMLLDLMPHFERTVTLFDAGNEIAGFRLARQFPTIEPVQLPPGVKDPAELTSVDFLLVK